VNIDYSDVGADAAGTATTAVTNHQAVYDHDTFLVISTLPTYVNGTAQQIEVTDLGSGSFQLNLASVVDLGDASRLVTDEVRAYDAAGLKLYDDSGTAGLFVKDGGNIGIGTDNPDSSLHIKSNSTSSLKIEETGTDSEPVITLANDVYRYTISLDGSNNDVFRFRDNIAFADRFVIDNNGNLGINENSPGTLLDMAGTAPYLTIHNTTEEDTDGGREGKIIFEGEQSGGELSTLAEIQASHDGTSDDTKGDLIFSTNDGASLSEAGRFDSGGRFGVGTTNPGAGATTIKMHVVVSGNLAYDPDDPGRWYGIKIENTDTTDDKCCGWYIRNGTSDWFLGTVLTANSTGKGDFVFANADNALNDEAMRIKDSGYIGIGIVNPTSLVHINGSEPYLTLMNNTHEDTDGGRESKIIFQGEQSGGERSTLAEIQASHDGTSDDTNGELIFRTNNGSSVTGAMRIDSLGNIMFGSGITSVGGCAGGLIIKEGTAPSSGVADQAFLWAQDDSGTAELYVQDGAGNQLKLSGSPVGEWIYEKRNAETGKGVRVDMMKALRAVEKFTGE
ncbi:MAG: hypothetical protein JSV16_06770, partial [Candidatus Hydrogenedentota bacterium]